MTSITQQIPNYVGGISQQPDELKVPGQVRTAKNVLPDVTHGLLKRPGGRLIGNALSAYTTTSKWFHYYRDENEQYIGQIQGSDGQIKMWRCSDGQAMTVTNNLTTTTKTGTYTRNTSGVITVTISTHGYKLGETVYLDFTSGATDAVYKITDIVDANNFKVEDGIKDNAITSTAVTSKSNYLIHLDDADIQTLTLNDYTYLTNRNKTAAMLDNASTVNPLGTPQVYIELKKVAYASQYSVNLFDQDGSDASHFTTVNTATRIKVTRVVDSKNSCRLPPLNNNTDFSAADRGAFPQIGYEPGIAHNMTNQSDSSGGTYNNPCDTNRVYDDLGDKADNYCPNVDTQIFEVSHDKEIDTDDINGVGTLAGQTIPKYSVIVKSGNTGVAADRKFLYLRIITTGQAVPESKAGDDAPKYWCRYTTTHDLLYGGEGWQVGDKVDVWMKNAKYEIEIEEISTSKVQSNLGLIRPNPTSFDTKTTVTAESIIGSIRSAIIGTTDSGPNTRHDWRDANVQQIGNGIYISRPSNIQNGVEQNTFNISTPVGELLNVLSNSVKDVAELPKQCKNGYVVKVANSEADEDDYYVKFIGNNNRDGDGVWEECPEPGVKTQLDPATMPVQLVRQADGTFTVSQVAWDERLVGDTTTAPEPSFIGKTINKMLFFRNRLVMLSDENVIMSRPGDFYNFWPKSAITFTATDNIDISCSSEYPAIVYDGLQVNSGLVLFTKNQQFMLTTDSDVLSPLTAKINSLSSYNFNFETNPISLGTTIAFLDNAGKYTRFFEMQAVLREGEPNVLEQSKNISKLFPKDINLVANSRENGTIFFGVKGTNKLYGFRYYQTGERRVQQAWFEWELSGTIQHIAMLDDAVYVVVKNTGYTMQKFSIKLDDNSHTLVEDATYRVHLDNSKVFNGSKVSYVEDGDYTKVDHTAADFSGSGQLYAVAVSTSTDKEFNGLVSKVTTFADSSDADKVKVKIPGNWKTYVDKDGVTQTPATDIVIGYDFDMEVEFPYFYVTQQEGERFTSDVQSSLVLHRIKLSLGPTGVYKTTLKRIGKPDYNETFESVMADAYTVNTAGIDKEQIATLPVYEKNTNLTLTLKSTHPTPATLYSLNWEGDYSNRYYQRV